MDDYDRLLRLIFIYMGLSVACAVFFVVLMVVSR